MSPPVRILKGATNTLIITVTVAVAFMTFDAVRQLGVSLFASAGIAGIIVGFAARPMLSNLIAGLQLAITPPDPARRRGHRRKRVGLDRRNHGDICGRAAVGLAAADRPLTYFIEKPFQNWTRESASLIGIVLLRVDFLAPIELIRIKAEQLVRASKLWDRRVLNVQVTDADHRTIEVRVLASAATSGATFDLRCELREKLIAFLAKEHPQAPPRAREEFTVVTREEQDRSAAPPPKRFSQRAS